MKENVVPPPVRTRGNSIRMKNFGEVGGWGGGEEKHLILKLPVTKVGGIPGAKGGTWEPEKNRRKRKGGRNTESTRKKDLVMFRPGGLFTVLKRERDPTVKEKKEKISRRYTTQEEFERIWRPMYTSSEKGVPVQVNRPSKREEKLQKRGKKQGSIFS